jgi:hypothetical protein
MRLLKNPLPSFVLLCLTIAILSCGSKAAQNSFKENDKTIPVGFGKEDVTILAFRKDKKYDQWLEEYLSTYYKGKYVIIDPRDETNGKYSDTYTYRYLFGLEETVTKNFRASNSFENGFENQANEYTSFMLKDRSTGKIYHTNHIYGAPKAIMRDYIIKLEKIRAKNSQ